MRQAVAPSRPRAAAGRLDRHPLRDHPRGGPQQAAGPGVLLRRWPGAERHRAGGPGQPHAGTVLEPARHRPDRPARHRPQRTAELCRRKAHPPLARQRRPGPHGRGLAPVPRGPGAPPVRRPAPVHDDDRDAGYRRRASRARRHPGEHHRRVLWHAGCAGVSAPVPAAGAPRGHRRRRPARHGASDVVLDRRAKRFRRTSGRLREGPPPASVTFPDCVRSGRHCCSNCPRR